MFATQLIRTLTMVNATESKYETATRVLTRLKEMKTMKGMPFFAIRRAIRMQKRIVNNLNNIS